MTFLNPLYLLALAAAAIPIILHLLNLRKSRIIEFSTLSFLKELQRSKIRRLKIKQLLLLLLRIAIIIFLVLAFSRPALRGTLGNLLGAKAKSSVVIILDDSFSMVASDEGGQLFRQARAKAKSIIEALQPGDEAAIVRLSSMRKNETQFTAGHQALFDEIENASISYAHGKFYDALVAAHFLLEQSKNINKELYVITDEQKSHYVFDEKEKKAGVALFDASIKLFLIPLGPKAPNNSSIASVKMLNSIFEKEKPIALTATVRNYGNRALRDNVVSLYVSGERIMQKTVEVEPGASKEVEFSFMGKTTGFNEGFVQIEDDELSEDNRRYFSFYIPDKIDVLLITEKAADADFIELALQSREAASEGKVIAIERTTGAIAQSMHVKKYDAIILLVENNMSASLREKIVSYVRDGGGVCVFPGSASDSFTSLNALLSALRIPPISGTNGSPGNAQSISQFGKTDFDHPLFSGVFDVSQSKNRPQIESPKIYYSYQLRASETSNAIISTSTGLPFLMEARIGEGKILLWAVAPVLRWSDLPVRGIFAPLMYRSIFYLSTRDYSLLSREVGETFEVMLPLVREAASSFMLKSPRGDETRIIPKTLTSGMYFTIQGAENPGNYTLHNEASIARIVSINLNPQESDLSRITKQEREVFWKMIGVENYSLISPGSDMMRLVTQSRFGIELWKYLLIAALLCAIAEMTLARDVKNKVKDADARG